ncbi:hypothetical protein DL771_008638 [Monosporascus sp. 5C6A]|nr:hypothetical protein DL771_008638 [Monosporascus sp. 5C6A]
MAKAVEKRPAISSNTRANNTHKAGDLTEPTDTDWDTESAPGTTDNEPSEDEAIRNEPSEDEAIRNEPSEDVLNKDTPADAFEPKPLNIRAQFLSVIKVTVDGKPPKEQPNRIRNVSASQGAEAP